MIIFIPDSFLTILTRIISTSSLSLPLAPSFFYASLYSYKDLGFFFFSLNFTLYDHHSSPRLWNKELRGRGVPLTKYDTPRLIGSSKKTLMKLSRGENRFLLYV